jgi:cellulose synthase/poly-beta-1,6-N-acetylglucosamine synthase-like glycosyltransferase
MMVLQMFFMIALAILSLPVLLLFVQVVFSLRKYHTQPMPKVNRPSVAVLIPAHNESSGLIPTLQSLKTQLQTGDRIVLVADNCSDDTASVAKAEGIEVIERSNLNLRGKGYALDFGMRYLMESPPEVVIIVDADCIVEAEGLDRLARTCVANNRPVQALYLMKSPAQASLKTKIAEFAWAVKDWARPLGYLQLGLPCQLMGTGMAFPWALLQSAELATGHIVEDLKLGLEFASARRPPLFCPEVLVTSTFPQNNEGVQSQRTRWEHGHLSMILKDGPRELMASINAMNLGLFALAIDMCVPPLALLMLLVLALCCISLAMALLTTNLMPWLLVFFPLLVLVFGILFAWTKFGSSIITLRELLSVPLYILGKVSLYIKFLVKRQVEWVRSNRD